MSDVTCSSCGLAMHRYGFPDDGMNHDGPSYVACVNSLRHALDGTVKQLNVAKSRAGSWKSERDAALAEVERLSRFMRGFAEYATGETRELAVAALDGDELLSADEIRARLGVTT